MKVKLCPRLKKNGKATGEWGKSKREYRGGGKKLRNQRMAKPTGEREKIWERRKGEKGHK